MHAGGSSLSIAVSAALAQYFGDFVEKFSTLIQPLRDAKEKLKKNEKVIWTSDLVQCFENMKKVILRSTLILPSANPKFILECDASDTAIGAILRDANHPVKPNGVCCFLSRQLKNAELAYGASEKEALAIKWAIDKNRNLLLGRKFTIFSDCKAWS